ncbi:unnamed protein product, partial [Adineta ricciae]
MSNKKRIRRFGTRSIMKKRVHQSIQPITASSIQSNPISTTQTTTINPSTSLKRSSSASQQKIIKKKKLDLSSTSSNSNINIPMDGYTIIQNQILFSLMSKTNCEACGNHWNGTMNINKREGLFLIICFQCSSCANKITIETSPKVVSSNRRDINVRSQIGGHLCGLRHAGLSKLVGIMNLPSPVQDAIYSKWDKNLLPSVKSFSNRSMQKGVEEAVAAANSTELMVSGDGFWQTRGFQSRQGAAAVLSCVSAPKVLDIETCSKTCNVCALSVKKSDPAKYKDIIRSHQCETNHDKSSGVMESHAVLTMFKRSLSKYSVYYTRYVGDGDSKTFAVLSKTTPYPGKEIKKIEDLNHFSKRMKRALETKKRELGRKKLSDGKTIGGKNRLSAQAIIRLQMAFRSTIKKCKNNLNLLRQRSWAIFWHKYSTNNEPHHEWCSVDWCGYLKSIRDGTSYDHTSHALPRAVLDVIKPVFKNLCSRESLTRVIDASSSNPNEGFHSLVWLMSPKHKASSGTTFQIACHLAVIIFNDGYLALVNLLNAECGYRGHYTEQAMIHFDNSRLHTESKEMNRKKRKEASRIVQQNTGNDNDDGDGGSDGDSDGGSSGVNDDDNEEVETTDGDDEETTDGDDEETTDGDDEETTDGDDEETTD